MDEVDDIENGSGDGDKGGADDDAHHDDTYP